MFYHSNGVVFLFNNGVVFLLCAICIDYYLLQTIRSLENDKTCAGPCNREGVFDQKNNTITEEIDPPLSFVSG